MISFFRWILSVIIMVSVILFTFANREIITVTFSPFHDSVEVFSFVLALGAFALGFTFGGIMVWLNSTKLRIERRKQKKEITRLENEIEDLQNKADSQSAAQLIEHLE